TRKVILEIEMPATQITSLAFGGPKLDILYVVTANKDGLQPEGSGYLYKITGLGVRGYTGFRYRNELPVNYNWKMCRLTYLICWSLVFLACSVLGYQIQRLHTSRNTLSEVPYWDAKTRSLYYVDIAGSNSSIHRYDYDEDQDYRATIDMAPNLRFILPINCAENYFLVGIGLKAVIVHWNGRAAKASVVMTLFEIDENPVNLINDIKTDARGRFYGGTNSNDPCDNIPNPSGGFYKYNKRKGLHKFFGNVSISNGLTWVRQTNKFYYVDSCTHDIKEFHYNPENGDLTNERQIYSLIQNGVTPDFVFDGMTSDLDGNLYLATFGGSKIVKFDPRTKKVVLEIEMPATQVTSLAFGGPKLDILYVTT
ncbi:regucalcin-like, partial [Sitodiplosis mosellana]|uniref:regucalcin-like n=1 Tax=Sitodiplosis mosellana TaxID=263140 RepID=UPI002445161B